MLHSRIIAENKRKKQYWKHLSAASRVSHKRNAKSLSFQIRPRMLGEGRPVTKGTPGFGRDSAQWHLLGQPDCRHPSSVRRTVGGTPPSRVRSCSGSISIKYINLLVVYQAVRWGDRRSNCRCCRRCDHTANRGCRLSESSAQL